MPLHRKGKSRHIVDTKCFYEAIIGNGFDAHAICESRDGLRVQ